MNHIRHRLGYGKGSYYYGAERHPDRRHHILERWAARHRHWKQLLKHSLSAASVSLSVPWTSSWYAGAMCVHEHEGTWTSNTGNGYYGGFQYLPSTWLNSGGGKYAPRADLASPHEQLLVTWDVTHRYGWGQWPNTARMCGLL